MSNEEDLKIRHLPYTNLASTAAIVANCQPIRGEDLPIDLMPIKNTTGNREQNRGGHNQYQGTGNGGLGRNNGSRTEHHSGNNNNNNTQHRGGGEQRQIVNGQHLYHPIVRRVMEPVLAKINFFSMAQFLKRAKIDYQDITPTERPKLCTRMMLLGKCFEGCQREHTSIPDSWAKKVIENLKNQIATSMNERN